MSLYRRILDVGLEGFMVQLVSRVLLCLLPPGRPVGPGILSWAYSAALPLDACTTREGIVSAKVGCASRVCVCAGVCVCVYILMFMYAHSYEHELAEFPKRLASASDCDVGWLVEAAV